MTAVEIFRPPDDSPVFCTIWPPCYHGQSSPRQECLSSWDFGGPRYGTTNWPRHFAYPSPTFYRSKCL